MRKFKMKNISKTRFISMAICVILAIMCVGYGINVKSKGYGSMFFVIWIMLGVFFVMLAFAIKYKIWKIIPKWLKIIIVVCSFCGLSLLFIIEGMIIAHINDKGEKNLDYVIVLGAMVYEDGPSSILRSRLNAAIEYLIDNPNTMCIVSGGQGADEPYSEAYGMKKYLTENGIDESRIIEEDKSKNTIQNITNSMQFIKEDAKVGIVTSNFHVFRACNIARKSGLNNVSGIASNVVAAYMPENMFREFFGVIKDFISGNM